MKSNAFKLSFLSLIFNGTTINGLAVDADGAVENLYISLHTSDPSSQNYQSFSEATYTSYARIPVIRNASGWNCSSNPVINNEIIEFPQCTGGSNLITHIGIGTTLSGDGSLLFIGTLDDSMNISNLVQPIFDPGELRITES